MARKYKELTSEQYAALTYHKLIVRWVIRIEKINQELIDMEKMSEDYLKSIGLDPRKLNPKSYLKN